MRLLFSSFAYRHVASCKLDWQQLRRWMCRRVVVGSINMPAAYAINSIPTHPPRGTAALRGKDNRSTTLHVDETRVRAAHTYTVNTRRKNAGARVRAPRPRRKLPSTTHFLKYLLSLPVGKPIDRTPVVRLPTINWTLCQRLYRKSQQFGI